MKTNLEELKAEHETLTFVDKTKSEMLLIKFHSLLTIGTDKPNIEKMSDENACIMYELKNNFLKAKLELLDDLQKAIRDGNEDLIKELDYFNELGLKDKNERYTNIKS